MLQHGAQVFEVQQQQALVVCNFEHHVEHAGLGVVQIEHAAQQQRPHVGDGGAHGVACFTKHVPQGGGASEWGWHGHAALLQRRGQLWRDGSVLADTSQVAFDVSHEHGHADFGEAFGQCLQRHGLARAGGTCDEAMTVSQGRQHVAFGSLMQRN